MDWARKISFDHNGPPTLYKIIMNNCMLIDLVIRIELTLAILMLLYPKFFEKFDHPFSHVFIFRNMFPDSYGFVAMPVTSCIKDTCSDLSHIYLVKEMKLFDLVTATTTKPWLSGNMFPNIKTCVNGWSNFSENLRIVVANLLELTRFLSPNLLIYSYLL